MLKSLHVNNYVLIDSLDIDFPEGLIIITGQTGAGKSIILGALSLVLGAKAEASMIGENAENCVVEAEFNLNDNSVLKAEVEKSGYEWNNGNLIVRRVISQSGRSRAFLNDEPISLSCLEQFSSYLLDIHSQNATLLLKDKQFQLSLLDSYAGNGDMLLQCGSLYRSLISKEAELKKLNSEIEKIAKEKDYNEALFNRLDSAKLVPGELEELEAEQKRLSNAEEIKESLVGVENTFVENSESDGKDIITSLKEAVRLLSRVGTFIPEAEELSKRLDSARLELDDIYSEVTRIEETIDISSEKLEEVESRLSLIYDLLKLHSLHTVEELIAEKERLSAVLFDSSSLQEKKNILEADIDKTRKSLDKIVSDLHMSRQRALAGFSSIIQTSIRDLELDRAVFDVELTGTELSAVGADVVSFRFSSTGKSPIALAKCASGGELSRIMLCLKALKAKYSDMPSMIFDEIDTGVSGSVADKMGSMICSMGKYMQVFAITHLPQVAAKGKAHYLVSKEVAGDGSARTSIHRLSRQERAMEVARMLSASDITPEAIANANILIGD
jgi:hypothetical protein